MTDVITATPADAERLALLARQTYEETFIGVSYYTRELVEGYTRTAFSPAAFRSDLADPKVRIFLVEIAGTPAAYAKAVDGKTAPALAGTQALYLERLYVDARFQRRGLGALLLGRVYAEARARGLVHVWLSVWEHNQAAQAFYKALNYREIGDWEWAFESGGRRYVDRDLIYVVDL